MSVAAHAAVLWALLRVLPRPLPSRRRPIELVLVELPRERPHAQRPVPASPAAPSPPPPSSDRAEPPRTPRQTRRDRAAPGAAPDAAEEARIPARSAPVPPEAPAPGTREFLEAEGLIGTPGRGELRLGPSIRDVPRRDAPSVSGAPEGVPSQGPPGAESVAVRAERIRARIDAQLQDTLAADRARVLPDTYWSHLGARLEDRFRVGWSVLEQGSRDDAVMSGSRVAQALEAWQREAAEWGRTGRAPDPHAAARPGNPRSPGAPELMPEEAARTLFATELVTRLEIVQDTSGRITSVCVVGSSGNTAHDALALDHVRGAAHAVGASLGSPPEQGRRTWWAVRTKFSVFPPVPVAGCSFDATFHPEGCFYPLKRTVKTRFELERVWRGG